MIKQVLASCAGLQDVDRGIKTFFLERAIEMQLHVAGAFELFEDQFIHSAAGLNKRGCQDREAPTLLDAARRAEKFLRLDQRFRLDTAGHDSAFAGLQIVVAA